MMKRSGYMYLLAQFLHGNTLDRSKQRPKAPATIRPAASLDLFPLYLHIYIFPAKKKSAKPNTNINKWMDGAVSYRAKCANLRAFVRLSVIREDPIIASATPSAAMAVVSQRLRR